MKKIKEYILNLLINCKIERLKKVAVTFTNDYCGYYKEQGDRTYGRLNMFTALNCAMSKVYGNGWEVHSRINGFQFTEDKDCITVKVYTHKPSILIGPQGMKINLLEIQLTSLYGKKTKVDITETSELYGMTYVENY